MPEAAVFSRASLVTPPDDSDIEPVLSSTRAISSLLRARAASLCALTVSTEANSPATVGFSVAEASPAT